MRHRDRRYRASGFLFRDEKQSHTAMAALDLADTTLQADFAALGLVVLVEAVRVRVRDVFGQLERGVRIANPAHRGSRPRSVDLEMQVRPRRVSALSDVADELACFDVFPRLEIRG